MKRKAMSAEQNYHHGSLKRVIMDAALEMVAESGLESLSLREIARRIGVTTAAPYHHFKDRQSLLIELATAGFGELFEALKHSRDMAPANEDQVRAAVSTYLQFGQRHRALYSIMFSGTVMIIIMLIAMHFENKQDQIDTKKKKAKPAKH